jgi:hypothetical protein
MGRRPRLAVAHLAFHTPDPGPEPPAEGRLDSWKEIAAYLRRDVRTVQRWEKSEGLPVRRHQHDSLGSVYAYRHELDAWRAGRQPAPGPLEAATVRLRRNLRWAALGGLVVLASAGLIATRPLWNGQGTARSSSVLSSYEDRLPKSPHLATDGSRVYFSEQAGERWIVAGVPTGGGEPEIVPIPLAYPVVEDVSPDGSELLVTDRSARVLVDGVMYVHPLYRLPLSGGAPRRVGEVMTHSAWWLPDGRTILYGNALQLKTVDRDGSGAHFPRHAARRARLRVGLRGRPDDPLLGRRSAGLHVVSLGGRRRRRRAAPALPAMERGDGPHPGVLVSPR